MLDIQRKLVNIEVQKQKDSKEQRDHEEKKGKAQVTAKATEFRDKARRIEDR